MSSWGVPSGHSVLHIVGEPSSDGTLPENQLIELWDIQISISNDDEPRRSSRMSSGFYSGYLLIFHSSPSAMTSWGIPSGHSVLYIVGEPLLQRDIPGA